MEYYQKNNYILSEEMKKLMIKQISHKCKNSKCKYEEQCYIDNFKRRLKSPSKNNSDSDKINTPLPPQINIKRWKKVSKMK